MNPHNLVGSVKATHVSCERFNCITKFAYATSVGHQPGNPNKQNQDAYILVPNMLNQLGLHFFSVCDGHGANGHHVSQYLKEKLPCKFTPFYHSPDSFFHYTSEIPTTFGVVPGPLRHAEQPANRAVLRQNTPIHAQQLQLAPLGIVQ